MQNIFKIDAIRALRSVRVTTERLARVMRRDALSRKRDFQQIKELNYRLARVIPIIPNQLGAAGVIYGIDKIASSSDFGLPPFPPFGGLPPIIKGPGPKGPKGPPSGQPTGQPQIIKEELEEPQVVTEGEDIYSPEYNRRKQEEAKRKREQERIKELNPANVPAKPGQKPPEREKEAQPEPARPKPAEPQTPSFVPSLPPLKKPRTLESFAPPFIINDVATQRGMNPGRPRVFIPNFDPNDSKQRKDLNQKIFTYIFNNPKSRFAKALEGGVVLPDGTLIIRRPGQQIRYSEPLTEEQLGLIRIMGVMNISDWLPLVPIRGVPRKTGITTRSPITPRGRGTRGRDPIQQAKEKLERLYNQPSGIPGPPEPATPAAQPTQPVLPGASINQPTLSPSVTQPLSKTIQRSASQQTIDVQPLTKSVQRGNVEVGGSQGAKNPIPKTYKGSFSQQDPKVLQKRLEDIRKDRRERLLKDPTSDELNIMDALRQQGIEVPSFNPLIGPQASTKTLIQPVIIYRNA